MLRPLSIRQHTRVARTWDAIGPEQHVFVVWKKLPNGGREMITEPPAEDINPENAEALVEVAFDELLDARSGSERHREVVIRLFTTEEEAAFYMETVAAFHGIQPNDIEVAKVTLSELFETRDLLAGLAQEQESAGARFDLSRARVEEPLPETIDTIWSTENAPH